MKVPTVYRNLGADGGPVQLWGLQPPSPHVAPSLTITVVRKQVREMIDCRLNACSC